MLLLAAFFLSFFLLKDDFAQQAKPEGRSSQVNQLKEEEGKIVPSPKNIKESTAIYVFVAWMWLAIFALIYILRLKIKEADRLHQLGFLSEEKK